MSTQESTNTRSPKPLPPESASWLERHPEEKAESLEEVWQLVEIAPPADASFQLDPDRTAAMKDRIIEHISKERETRFSNSAPPTIGRLFWPIAASFFVLVALGAFIFWQPIVVRNDGMAVTTVALRDGSTIHLNAGSSISYRRSFGWYERSVSLDGEGYFAVATEAYPFEVHTANGKITVFGTKFGVRAWPGLDGFETQVVLTEGRVRFSGLGSLASGVDLDPGEMSRIRGSAVRPIAPVVVDTERFLIWRDGGLAHFNSPFSDIIQDLERRFAVSIAVSGEVMQRRVTIYLTEVNDIEAVLDVLTQIHGVQWAPSGGGYLIADAEK